MRVYGVCFRRCKVCFFFFSSRRRHTRLQGDWSSDVCSSDLDGKRLEEFDDSADKLIGTVLDGKYRVENLLGKGAMGNVYAGTHLFMGMPIAIRSEERRVGKECRSRWSPYH